MTQPTDVKAASTTQPHLPNEAHIGGAHLRVIDMERALSFYRDVLDFTIVDRDQQNVALAASADEAPILRLTEHRDALRKPQRSTGLY
ncbi:MAG: VOC family protein, partial [Chloroflexota bacterium]